MGITYLSRPPGGRPVSLAAHLVVNGYRVEKKGIGMADWQRPYKSVRLVPLDCQEVWQRAETCAVGVSPVFF